MERPIKQKKIITLFDEQQQKLIQFNYSWGIELAARHPERFKIHIPKKENNTMPQLPKETKRLANGMHTLIALEVATTKGEFGQQEEITALVEGTTDEMTRVWISHNSLKKIQAAEAAGLVKIESNTGEWEVIQGARFCAFVAGGKIVGVTAAPPVVIQQATATTPQS